MRTSRALAAATTLAVTIGLAAATGGPGATAAPPDPAAAAAGRERVIVLLDQPGALAARHDPGRARGRSAITRQRRELRQQQDTVVEAARGRSVQVDVRRSWTGLVNGFAATVPAGDLAGLRATPGVESVVPDQRVRLSTDTSVPLVGAPDVWQQDAPDGSRARGDGVVIAIVDSGVDYTNESLGEGFGEGHKVVAGHDFANDDEDPMDDNGHGTHVAGIAAGEGRITGVAPAATLTAWKVVDRGGAGYESDVLAGLEAAVDPANPHRADVVNMSLSVPGDGTDPVARAATVATRNGVVVVASAGNSGPAANTIGSPAVADGVISVGASSSGISVPEITMTSPDRLPLQTVRAGISANPPAEPVSGTVVDVGRGSPAELEAAGDLTGKVVAVRGRVVEQVEWTSPSQIKLARTIEETGAIGVVFYSPSSSGPVLQGEQTASEPAPGELVWPLTASGDSFRMDRLVVVGLRELEWEQLSTRLDRGPVTVRIAGRDVTDRVASFSSRGPTGSHRLEPDLVAPGIEILSAWPTRQWEPGIFRLSGTSMAAPHVAGAAALLRQLEPGSGPERIAARLVGSARLLDGPGPAAQGAGRLDVAAASRQAITATPTSLSFGLADMTSQQLRASEQVTLHNDGSEPVTLELRASGSKSGVGRANVRPGRVTIPPGGSTTTTLHLHATTPDTRSELSGWVEAVRVGSEEPLVRVPYLLPVVPVIVQASPDPGIGGTTLFIGAPADLATPPVVTVQAPTGKSQQVTAVHDHGTWWRATYRSDVPGVHRASVRATTALGPTTTGTGRFEVLPADVAGTDGWEPVGPNAQAGWIAESPADGDTMVADQPGKLSPWISTDDGETWREAAASPVADGEGTTVIDPEDAEQMWRAVSGVTDNGLYDPTYLGRILHTTDGGRSWGPLAAPDVPYSGLVTDSGGRVLVAVAADALHVSRDDGGTWTAHANPAGADVDDVAFSGDDLYLSSFREVWRVPGIAAGEPQPAEVVHDGDRVRGMVADDAAVAVLTGDNALLVSADGGASWTQRHQGPQYGPWDLLLSGEDYVITTYQGHGLVGRDHGASWSEVPYPVRGPIPLDVTNRDGELLWAEQNAGMVLGDADSGEFRDRIGVQGLTARDLVVTADDTLLATGTLGIFDTTVPTGEVTPDTREWGLNGNEGWIGRGVSLIDDAPSDESVLWDIRTRSFSTFDVMRSTDNGQTWQKRGGTGGGAHALAIDAHDPGSVAVSFSNLQGAGVHVTRDGGQTWRKMFHGDPFGALEPDPEVPGRLWLGGAGGLYVSDDFGVTLRQVRPGPVTALDVTAERIVVAGEGIAVSTNGGESFRDSRDDDLPTYVTDLVTSPADSHVVFAGTRQHIANGLVKNGRGVLMSTNGGRNWTNVSAGLQNTSIEALEMTDDGRWLFAGTTEGGVHRLTLGG